MSSPFDVVRAVLILVPLATCAARLQSQGIANDAIGREFTRYLGVVQAASRRPAPAATRRSRKPLACDPRVPPC